MHEVVNGANGSVTWCQGIDCPRCAGIRRQQQQFRVVAAPAIRLGDGIDVLPPWGYRIVGIG